MYAVPGLGEDCPVKLLKLYLSKLPRGSDKLWLQVVPEKIWQLGGYKSQHTQHLGPSTIAKFLPELCARCDPPIERRTNGALRVTTATSLFQKGAPEQLVMRTTGHKSNAVRKYQREGRAQLSDISNVLQQAPATAAAVALAAAGTASSAKEPRRRTPRHRRRPAALK